MFHTFARKIIIGRENRKESGEKEGCIKGRGPKSGKDGEINSG